MRRLQYAIVLLVISFLLPRPVEAHVLKTGGTIGAVMHVDPDDDPIAGSKSTFYLDFKDTTNRFKPEQCDCTLSIFQNGKEIYSQDLFENTNSPTLTSVAVVYTFPTRGEYTLKVSGKPYTAGTFKPFSLTYDIDVDQQAAKTPGSSQSIWISGIYSGAILIISITFIIFFVRRFKKKQWQKTKQETTHS